MRRRNTLPRTEVEAHEREQALAVLADMRREGWSLTKAARENGVTADVVHRYVGVTLRRTPRGYRPTGFDRLPRTLNVLTDSGSVTVTVRDSRTASRLGDYLNALKARRTGDTTPLAAFRGRSFRAGGVTYRFITDPEVLDTLEDAGELAIEGLYHAIQGTDR